MNGDGAASSVRDRVHHFRCVGLAVLAALLIATPLLPGESDAEAGTGCVLIMASFVLAAVAVVAGVLLGNRTYRLDWPDVAVIALLACFTASAWLTAEQGNPRATINAAWEWGSYGMLFLLVRQLVRTETETRALCVAMLVLAAALSALAIYQYFVTMPRLRAQYAVDPQRVLRDAGVEAAPGTPERKLFEDRLNSTEPTATFALTNSLAGFLSPWLLLTLGIGWQCSRSGQRKQRCLAGAFLCALALGFCLLLTKSRTAVLASGVGLLVLGWGYLRTDRRINWRIPVTVLAVLAALTVAATAAGAFDWLVLSETPKSVLYRLQYWQSTLAMIADQPWFGCGPGNFQQYYASYKLPEASEMIADPHNFLLEIWATGGTVAAVAFLALLALLLWRGTRGSTPVGKPEDLANVVVVNGGVASAQARSVRAIWIGTAIGCLLAFPVGVVVGFSPSLDLLWVGIPLAVAVAVLLGRWIIEGLLPGWLLLTSVLVLLLNLSAAGGIGFAGVASTFWLLAALVVNGSPRGARSVELPRWVEVTLCLLGFVLVIACHQTMYAPVLNAQSRVGEALGWGGQGRLELAEESLEKAVKADPYGSQSWAQLAALYHMQLLSEHSPNLQARFDDAVRQAEQRNRRSFAFQRQVGDWRLALYHKWGNSEQLAAAIGAYQAWVRLYPNSNLGHAQLAWVYQIAGDSESAFAEATEALRLDAATPHKERRLAEQQVYDPEPSGLPVENAEQLMRFLRSGRGP